jgi:galactan 5-O-arabinofuranosyltransferase
LDAPQPSIDRKLALEAAVAIATAAIFVASCALIDVAPRTRLGQISGLASLELRFFSFATALVIALLIAHRWRQGHHFELTSRLVCAAIAGLATGLIAGGILVALHGTPWGLETKGNDVTRLADWANALDRGENIPALYPPIPIYILAWFSKLVGAPPLQAVKWLQIAGTALFGPVAYLAWRPLLRAPWALAIGVIASVPLVDAYKPYPNLTLVAFIPITIWYLRVLRDCGDWKLARVVKIGAAFGAAFGILCLCYSGWFKWAAPGLVVAAAVVFPWHARRLNGAALLGVTLAVFAMVAGYYLAGAMFGPGSKLEDTYIYFDVVVEPMYIAMWKNDLPGNFGGVWPPIGEFGGVGLFTVVLTAGMGVAVAFGRRTTMTITLMLVMLGAWLFRFWYAHSLAATRLVQLYPRTTPLLLYCMIALGGFGLYRMVHRLRSDHPFRNASGLTGGLVALLLMFASVGSSICNQYMPSDAKPNGVGIFAWSAQMQQLATEHRPSPPDVMLWTRRAWVPRTVAP